MLLDKQTLLSDAQSIAQTAGTYVSTNTIDLGVAGTIPGIGGTPINDIGRQRHLELLVQVVETVASGGSATVSFQLIQSANADLSSPTVLQQTPAIAYAGLTAGYQARLAVPAGITQRYLGVQYVIATATTTAGKVTAGLVEAKQTNPTV